MNKKQLTNEQKQRRIIINSISLLVILAIVILIAITSGGNSEEEDQDVKDNLFTSCQIARGAPTDTSVCMTWSDETFASKTSDVRDCNKSYRERYNTFNDTLQTLRDDFMVCIMAKGIEYPQ